MRGGWAWGFSAAVAAAVLAPSVAPAQVTGSLPVQPGQRSQDVDLIGEILYDSNVASGDAAVAAARGITQSDVLFEPRLHFTLARPLNRETFYVSGDAGYDFHARNSILNRENLDIHSGVLRPLGPCQTDVNGEYSRAQSDLSELARLPTGSVVDFEARNVLQVEQVGGDATCVRATGFGPSLTASEIWTQNSSALERFVDAQIFSGSAGLTYQRPVLGSVRLFGAFSDTDFPNRAALANIPGGAAGSGYHTISGGVTYTRALGSRLEGSVSVSYTQLTQRSASAGAGPGFSGPTYSAALVYQLSSRLRATGTVSRATVPSNRLNSTFAIDQLYSGGLTYMLGSRLTIDGGASFAHNAYNGSPVPASFDITDEKIYTAYGDVALQITRRFSLEFNVRQLQRNVNLPGLSFPETRVGLTARAHL